jgi:octaheme c-type cytochrome (tetrathionate reductase family)
LPIIENKIFGYNPNPKSEVIMNMNPTHNFPWRRSFALLPGLCLLAVLVAFSGKDMASAAPTPNAKPTLAAKQQLKETTTADHSKFEALQLDFKKGPEVTAACLSCHTEAGKQFQKTIHWTWVCPKAEPEAKLGKAGHVVNNFCIAVPGNEPRCTSCHAGYGWKDKNFDLSVQENIDCLVCHEQTGTYKKFPTGAGNPVSEPTVFKGNKKTYLPPEWKKVAQSVDRPTRRNCGTCHFYGGGGDGVKHGDLDSSMMNPSKSLDIHMAVDGSNFNCTRCHETTAHGIAGRCYKTPAAEDRRSLVDFDKIKRITCESCHTETPHKTLLKANDHTDKVACQTCHIPEFARVNPTKMWWDWSKAGKKKDGKPFVTKDEYGKPNYHTKKGEFRWEKNVKPEYAWFNGVILNTMVTDKIDPSGVVKLTKLDADRGDPNARIYPFKVHRGKQPYDKINQTMAFPKLFGKKGSGAYWAEYDWKKSIQAGMDYAEVPYSGEFDWVETEYLFQITHMVAPKEKALACTECHGKEGRLADLAGFYMPGRDASRLLNVIGWGSVLVALVGVLLHGTVRMIRRK